MTEPEINGNLTHSTSVEDLSEYTDADESISAPTEILAEFLSSIMMKDFNNALKYCKAILSYEPNNSTAKEFYPLLLEKLEIMKKEEESDESSSESLYSSYNSSSSGSKKCSDSEDTSGSFTSLEDDEDDDKNNTFLAKSIPNLPMDIKNGNVNNIEANISIPSIANNIFKKSVEDVEKLEQIERNTENRPLKSLLQNISIHSTESTKTIKNSDSSVLPRTRTYVKNFSSELQNEVSINDSPALVQENTKKLNLQNANPKKMESTKKIKSSRTSINCAKKI